MPESLQSNNKYEHNPSCLYASFVEDEYQFYIYIPSNSRQTLQWLIRVYKENERQLVLEETFTMTEDHKFYVSGDDIKALAEGLRAIKAELAAQEQLADTSAQQDHLGMFALPLTVEIPAYVGEQLTTDEKVLAAA